MRIEQVIDLVTDAHLPDDASQSQVNTALVAISRLTAWCDAQRLACVTRSEQLGAVAEQVLTETIRATPRQAVNEVRRAATATQAGEFATALGDGAISAGHLDELGRTLRRLQPELQEQLLDDSTRLLAIATNTNPDDFARTLRREERRLTRDDGTGVLQRQQAAVRLRSRLDPDDGMHTWTLRVDPVTHLRLHNLIHATTDALFHDHHPDGCPTDPIERQAFLRAHALCSLLFQPESRVRLGRPEIIVVIDTTHPHQQQTPVIDWGIPIEIPERVLHDLLGVADIHTVIIRHGIIVHAPGQLNLQRSTRLANRAQRRALRAVYPTCAIPGCSTRYDHCTIHHVIWWRHGGRTNLDNLIPLCHRHHHKVHHNEWVLRLHADRTLIITHPDGTTMTTGPPVRSAA